MKLEEDPSVPPESTAGVSAAIVPADSSSVHSGSAQLLARLAKQLDRSCSSDLHDDVSQEGFPTELMWLCAMPGECSVIDDAHRFLMQALKVLKPDGENELLEDAEEAKEEGTPNREGSAEAPEPKQSSPPSESGGAGGADDAAQDAKAMQAARASLREMIDKVAPTAGESHTSAALQSLGLDLEG